MKGVWVPPGNEALEYINKYKSMTQLTVRDITMLNLEVSDILKQLKIAHSLERRVSMLDVDLVVNGIIPGDIEICIDIHGYHHYFRNQDILLGANHLKRKLVHKLGYGYFEVSLPVWDMLDVAGKLDYLQAGIDRLRYRRPAV